MKVIDILNKIANGEEVPRFIVKGKDYYDEEYEYVFEYYNSLRNATCGKMVETKIDGANYRAINSTFLNDEVEIIEEDKKIEKIEINYLKDDDRNIIIDKINEIIDYLNSKGDSGNV